MGTTIALVQQELPFENRGSSKDQEMNYLNIQPNIRFQERYKLHQYWARKPWYVVKRCIEYFTNEGDTILDPFCGSGITACESLISRRKVIAMDLNPIASFITKVTCCSPINVNVFETAFEKIKENIADNLSFLYTTECPNCGKSATIINTLWRNSDPYAIFYYCEHCRESSLKDITDYDRNKSCQIDRMDIPYWYPKGIKVSKDADVSYLDELFTKRNIIALSTLNKEIETLKEDTIKQLLRLMFSSIIPRTSKLVFVNDYRFKKGINPAGVWGEKRFWVPGEYVENNVFYYFKARFSKFMNAKRETNKLIGNYYKEGETIQIHTGSATNLSMVSSNSIDYCFTDPPYGGAIRYLDLSVLWNSWLQFPMDGDKEIIVKNGNVPAYQTRLQKAFQEIYRVLKPRAYFSVTFHSTNISVWRSLLEACRDSGFCLSRITTLRPIKRSHNQIDMRGTVKTDLLLTFKKSGMEKFVPTMIDNPPNIQKIISLAAKELIERDGSASTAEIYDKVIIEWSSIVYQYRTVPKNVNLSINSLRKTLVEHRDFESFEKIVSDYKGNYRRIEKWRMKTLGC